MVIKNWRKLKEKQEYIPHRLRLQTELNLPTLQVRSDSCFNWKITTEENSTRFSLSPYNPLDSLQLSLYLNTFLWNHPPELPIIIKVFSLSNHKNQKTNPNWIKKCLANEEIRENLVGIQNSEN